ncbi:hypothetical protein ABK040_005154 [Willaertia magna]
MVISTNLQLVSSNKGWYIVEANTLSGKSIRYENEFLAIQALKKGGGLFSSSAPTMTYRIILQKTESFLDSKSSYYGKKLVLSESENWSEILSDWEKLDSYLLPMITVISKKGALWKDSDLLDTLLSVSGKKIYKQSTLKPLGNAKTKKKITIDGLGGSNNKNNDDNWLEDDEEETTTTTSVSSAWGISKGDETGVLNSDSGITNYQDAVVATEEFILLIAQTMKIVDNKKVQPNQRAINDVQKNIKQLKQLQKSLDEYFKSSEKNVVNEKLQRQYSDEKPKLNKLLNHSFVKKINEEGTVKKKNTAKDIEYTVENGDDNNGQQQVMLQQQQKKQQFVLSQWDRNTIDVETALANETKQDLIKLETDFNEIHGMMKDFHGLVHENQEYLDIIADNVEESNVKVQAGTQNIKGAKKIQRFGLF